jgi:hypothetical protein
MPERGLCLPQELWDSIDAIADERLSSSSQVIREILVLHMRKRGQWDESQAVSPREDGGQE